MLDCTCGAKSVSSNIHMHYCDVTKAFVNDTWELIKRHLTNQPHKTMLYLTFGPTAKETAFRIFKEYMKSGWLITSETGDSNFIFCSNQSDVHFINYNTVSDLGRFNPYAVLIEDSAHNAEVMKEMHALIPYDGFVSIVNPQNGKVV